jgi:hypothetical protein
MKYRQLGKNGPTVSAIGYGAMAELVRVGKVAPCGLVGSVGRDYSPDTPYTLLPLCKVSTHFGKRNAVRDPREIQVDQRGNVRQSPVPGTVPERCCLANNVRDGFRAERSLRSCQNGFPVTPVTELPSAITVNGPNHFWALKSK